MSNNPIFVDFASSAAQTVTIALENSITKFVVKYNSQADTLLDLLNKAGTTYNISFSDFEFYLGPRFLLENSTLISQGVNSGSVLTARLAAPPQQVPSPTRARSSSFGRPTSGSSSGRLSFTTPVPRQKQQQQPVSRTPTPDTFDPFAAVEAALTKKPVHKRLASSKYSTLPGPRNMRSKSLKLAQHQQQVYPQSSTQPGRNSGPVSSHATVPAFTRAQTSQLPPRPNMERLNSGIVSLTLQLDNTELATKTLERTLTREEEKLTRELESLTTQLQAEKSGFELRQAELKSAVFALKNQVRKSQEGLAATQAQIEVSLAPQRQIEAGLKQQLAVLQAQSNSSLLQKTQNASKQLQDTIVGLKDQISAAHRDNHTEEVKTAGLKEALVSDICTMIEENGLAFEVLRFLNESQYKQHVQSPKSVMKPA